MLTEHKLGETANDRRTKDGKLDRDREVGDQMDRR